MRCSFCCRPVSKVTKLVAGPLRFFSGRVYICDRCAVQTMQIIETHSGDDQPLRKTPSLSRRILDWFGREHRSGLLYSRG